MSASGLAVTSAATLLDREFLEVRAKLLEVAAALDRIDRAPGSLVEDARFQQIQQAIAVVADSNPARAERLQLVFSRLYDPQWRQEFRLEPASS